MYTMEWKINLLLTCKKGSLIPLTSCSGEYPDCKSDFSERIKLEMY